MNFLYLWARRILSKPTRSHCIPYRHTAVRNSFIYSDNEGSRIFCPSLCFTMLYRQRFCVYFFSIKKERRRSLRYSIVAQMLAGALKTRARCGDVMKLERRSTEALRLGGVGLGERQPPLSQRPIILPRLFSLSLFYSTTFENVIGMLITHLCQ